jgi:hypothetical protein
MEQLSLPLITEQASSYEIVLLRNDIPILTLHADALAEAQSKRRDLVDLLQRDPRNRTVWEDNPRPTGWWGLRPTPPLAAAVYNIRIESVRIGAS